MTDKEAFETFDKYSDEQTRSRLRLMLHVVGVDKTLKIMIKTYSERGKPAPPEFIEVMKRAFAYMSKQMAEPLN